MAEERRIVELGVGDVDLVEGLWKEMVAHHREVTGGDLSGVRDPRTAWRDAARAVRRVARERRGLPLSSSPARGPRRRRSGTPSCGSARPARPGTSATGSGTWSRSRSTAAARGMGIGTELIEHCRERLRELGAQWWNVSVVSANEGAIDLYEREGFRDFWRTMTAPIE